MSPGFKIDLSLMYDVLFELSELSESLQDCDCTILIADKLLHKYIKRLEKSGVNTRSRFIRK